MEILATVEENAHYVIPALFGMGVLQGAILARGIRTRFPRLKKHTRIVSAIFLTLFSISAAANVAKFANPAKYEFAPPDAITLQGIAQTVLNVVGIDGGLVSSFLVLVSVLLFLVFRAACLPSVARYFVFVLSVATFGVFVAARFTDFVPNILQLLMYAAYQVGIAAGVFVISRRREKLENSFV